MNQKDKELLLKDLCARLPYGVIGEYSWKRKEPYNKELTGNLYDELNSSWSSTDDSKFIPYLRPMSSMTEEEKDIYAHRGECLFYDNRFDDAFVVDWLNANHFDYRGLIEKGLAFKVIEENNPYKD